MTSPRARTSGYIILLIAPSKMSTTQLLIVVLCACLTTTATYNNMEATDDDVINPHPYRLILNHPHLCNATEPEVQLLVMIVSSPDKFQRRSAIRNSWGLIATGSNRRVKRLFLLGLPSKPEVQTAIQAENALYRDILQEDFNDTYRNLPIKTMMMIKWALDFCGQAHFLLKIDDDVFLNPRNLFRLLERSESEVDEAVIVGLIYRKYKPHRSHQSKYFVSSQEYSAKMYPDFAVGPSYLYTRGALPALYETALRTKPIVLEDVFFNGIVAQKANVTLVNEEGFNAAKKLSACNVFQHMVTYHGLDQPNKLALVWWLVNNNRMDYCGKVRDKGVKRLGKLINRKKLIKY